MCTVAVIGMLASVVTMAVPVMTDWWFAMQATCSIDISAYADRNKTLSITFANYAAGYTGTIIYDDIMAGETTLFDFNKDKYDAFKRGFENTEEMIPEIKIVYSEDYTMGNAVTANSIQSETLNRISS